MRKQIIRHADKSVFNAITVIFLTKNALLERIITLFDLFCNRNIRNNINKDKKLVSDKVNFINRINLIYS